MLRLETSFHAASVEARLAERKAISHWSRLSEAWLTHTESFLKIKNASTISLDSLFRFRYITAVSDKSGSHPHCRQCIARCEYGEPLRELKCSLSLMFKHLPVWPIYLRPHEKGIEYTTLRVQETNRIPCLTVHIAVLWSSLLHMRLCSFGQMAPTLFFAVKTMSTS